MKDSGQRVPGRSKEMLPTLGDPPTLQVWLFQGRGAPTSCINSQTEECGPTTHQGTKYLDR